MFGMCPPRAVRHHKVLYMVIHLLLTYFFLGFCPCDQRGTYYRVRKLLVSPTSGRKKKRAGNLNIDQELHRKSERKGARKGEMQVCRSLKELSLKLFMFHSSFLLQPMGNLRMEVQNSVFRGDERQSHSVERADLCKCIQPHVAAIKSQDMVLLVKG